MAAGISCQAGASRPGFHQQTTELIMAPAASPTAPMTAACMSSVRAGCRADDQRGNDMAVDERMDAPHERSFLPDRGPPGPLMHS